MVARRSRSAERWRAQRRSSRVWSWALTIAWTALLVLHAATAPDVPCTLDRPCATEPLFAVVLAGWMVGLGTLRVAPAAAMLAFTLVGGLMLFADPDAGAGPVWSLPAVLLVTVATLAYSASVLMGRWRQWATAADAARAGPAVVVPQLRPSVSVVLGLLWLRIAVTVVALVVGLGMLGFTAMQRNADTEHAAEAELHAGVVRAADADEFTVEVVTADESVLTLDAIDPAMYPIGSRVRVLIDGQWARLAAEPYDATLWMAGAFAVLAAGALLGLGVLRSARVVSGIGRRHGALRVLVGADGESAARVWAADAGRDDQPLFDFHFAAYGPDAVPPPGTVESPGGPAEIPELLEELRRREPAILHSIPFDGAMVAVEVHPRDGGPVLLVPFGAVRAARDGSDAAAGLQQTMAGHQRAAATMSPSRAPREYRIPVGVRAAVLAAWVGLLVFGGLLMSDTDGVGAFQIAGLWLTGLSLSWYAVRAAVHKVVADAAGIHVRTVNGWQARLWDELTVAVSDATSVAVITNEEGRDLDLSAIPGSFLLRRIGLINPADRCADEVNAMITEPRLRPHTRWQAELSGSFAAAAGLALLAWTAVVAVGLALGGS